MGPKGSRDRGKRTVNGVEVQITELIWPDGGRSFELVRVADETDLTPNECFDNLPSDGQIATALEMHAERQALN